MTAQAGTAYVDVRGDFSALDKGIDNATRGTKSKFAKVGKAAVLGLGAGLAGAGVAVKGFVDAAGEAEKSQASMDAQLRSMGSSYKAHAKQIDEVIAKHSALSGFDDEDLQDSFTNIVRVTGDVNKSLKLNQLAMDVARAKHMDVAKAGELVGKVAGGNTGILSRYGIQVKEGATATEALALMQGKFAGQAEAYGKTTAGAQDRFKVAVEGLQEALGQRLLPIIATVADKLAVFINGMSNGTGAGGRFAAIVKGVAGALKGAYDWLIKKHDALGMVRTAIGAVVEAVGIAVQWLNGAFTAAVRAVTGWVEKNRAEINAFADAMTNIANVVRNVLVWTFNSILVPALDFLLATVRRVWPAIKAVVSGALEVISGIIKTFSGVFTGDFRRMWDGIKSIFSGTLEAIGGLIRGVTAPFREAAARIGSAIAGAFSDAWETVRDGVRKVIGFVGDRIDDLKGVAEKLAKPFVGAFQGMRDAVKSVIDFVGDLIDKVKDVIGFIGKIKIPKIDLPDLNPFGGAGNGTTVGPGTGPAPSSVQGLDPLAARFGLQMTSGYRPGDDGWHGQNRARDYSNSFGPTPQMLAFAKYLAGNFGAKLLELIYTPLGFGIKNGKVVPNSFWGVDILGAHYNHVHVAMARGGILHSGGLVKRPTIVMGEEAPRFPEFVIPTNPAYRDRAHSLLGQAAVALGPPTQALATGGIINRSALTADVAGLPFAPEVRVFVGNQEIKDIVRVEVTERRRDDALGYLAGAAR